MGSLINVNATDSIRIALPKGGAITLPVGYLLAIDCLLTFCHVEDSALDLDMVEDDATGWEGWQATCENPDGEETLSLDGNELLTGCGDTPWGAMVALADAVRAARRAER